MIDFDPNGVGQDNGNYFGLPFTPETAALVLVSVPWEVTASYGAGTAAGPDAIIEASTQLDLYDRFAPNVWHKGIGTVGVDYSIAERSERLRDDAEKVFRHLTTGGATTDDNVRRKIERINTASAELNEQVYEQSKHWLERGKLVGLVGGDHSTPYGHIRAVAEHNESIGVLHLDAHRDLRERYEGFEHSHASIMYNVLENIDGVEKLVQVGVRDWCDAEQEYAVVDERVVSFDDYTLMEAEFTGKTWNDICKDIVAELPEKVYISFDIDSLTPECCPNTGTPVAGGLSFNKIVWLLHTITESGRRVVGFDLCEVSPELSGQWNANVGARVLYKLCCAALKTY